MEKVISNINMIKGIPVSLVRPLPTVYYYGVFYRHADTTRADSLFRNSVNYLAQAIDLFSSELEDANCSQLVDSILELNSIPKQSIIENLTQITSQLSNQCVRHRDEIKKNLNLSKQNLAKLYYSNVQPLKVLLIDNNYEYQRVDSLKITFTDTCFYDVSSICNHAENFVDKIKSCDFIIFTSAFPITINEDVQNISQYKKPFLIMADIKKEKALDQQTIRNGSWLQKKGYEVLYKIFTPMRLFTTVDKIFMKHQFE